MDPAPDDLIVAPATGAARGALAIVRVTGAGSIELASRLTGREQWLPRRATRVRLRLGEDLVEDAVVTAWVGPHSYSGQDLIEISSHGSPVIVDLVVRACIGLGARLARAGEFTLRAYLNQRIDLLQAEAVADLVSATTSAQVRVASGHLDGTLSERIRGIGDGIAEMRALLEASLDFPDEGFHFITPQDLVRRIAGLQEACAQLLGSADAGRRLHDGATIVIVGRPNAGKSSLFNALLRRQRAIVTDVPGTTRDLLTEVTELAGVPVTLVDTAGLRETDDVIEREGVARTQGSMAAADVVLLVVDPGGSAEDVEQSGRLWSSLDGRPGLVVMSKADVAPGDTGVPAWCPAEATSVSAVTGDGLADLELRLGAMLGRSVWEGATLTRGRHRELVSRCAYALRRASEEASAGASEEFVLVELHDALVALAELRGVETPDEVLTTIFGSFCIGK